MRNYNKPIEHQNVAKERINELFALADSTNKDYANKYVELARKISMKYKVPIPKDLKKRICKNCYTFLKPGVNLRVRRNDKGIIYTCLECNKQMRFPIK